MAAFLGGSAWAMTRDISEGHILVTDRLVRRFGSSDQDRLIFEIDKRLRELRADQPSLDDQRALLTRNRKIQRLNQALRIVRSVRFGRRG